MSETVQQVLSMTTSDPRLRADVDGWGWEDPRCVKPGPIGLSISWRKGEPYPQYDCVLRAMADGWKLLGQPEEDKCSNEDGDEWTTWNWMLVREVPR